MTTMTDGQITYTLLINPAFNPTARQEVKRYTSRAAAARMAERATSEGWASGAAIRQQTVGQMDPQITLTFGNWQ